MIDNPVIRKVELEDTVEIARLVLELGYNASCADIEHRLINLLESDRHLVVVAAMNDSKLMGWVAAEARLILESGERVELVGLVVDATGRRKGVGRALVAAAENWAKELGLSRVVVRSNTERPASHSFFEAIGYVKQKSQHTYNKNLTSV